MWQRIGTEQYEQALELAVIVDGLVRWSAQPCRRVVGGWVECATHDPVRQRPTHWRPAPEGCRCSWSRRAPTEGRDIAGAAPDSRCARGPLA
jgi:hypothetical protein